MPGTLFLIDTSAMARLNVDTVRNILARVIDAGVAATCITVELEAGYSGRTAAEIAAIFKTRQDHFAYLPVTDRVAERARTIQQLMAARGLHRAAGAMDVLTAAVADVHRATILHYDADFDHIASVTGQQCQWIVPRATID